MSQAGGPISGIEAASRKRVRTFIRRCIKESEQRHPAKEPHDATRNLYRRLDAQAQEIRILIVEPGELGPIKCWLYHASLKSDPEPVYETISYVWGNASSRGTIFLNGKQTDVPASSEAVLCRMRKPLEDRHLWIDAICINQGDDQERAEQVAMMGDIYARGMCNLVWLGEDHDTMTERALVSIRLLLEDMRIATNDFAELTSKLYREDGSLLYSDTAALGELDADAIVAFFSSAWFMRLWVAQEAALARRSTCHRGRFEVDLDDVFHVAVWLRHLLNDVPLSLANHQGCQNAAKIADLSNSGCGFGALGFRPDFLHLLIPTRELLALQPEDHIFALVGLYQNRTGSALIPESLAPRYGTPLAEIFASATRHCIEERNDLDVLSHMNRREDEIEMDDDFPSWVLRWDRPFDISCDPSEIRLDLFRAAGDTEWHPALFGAHDTKTLIVQGLFIGRVLSMSRSPNSLEDDLEIHNQVEAWFNEGLDIRKQHVNETLSADHQQDENHLAVEIAIALVGGKDHNREPISSSDAVNGHKACRDALANGEYIPYVSECDDTTPEESKMASAYYQAFKDVAYDRKAFLLYPGHVGFGPNFTEVGDIAIIAYGSKLPLIIRPKGEAGVKAYSYIGVCYIHGIMHGEAYQEHRQYGREDKIFNLV